MRSPIRRAVAGVLLCFGCGANNTRPDTRPLPDAVLDTVPGVPEGVLDALSAAIVERGFVVSKLSLEEGFLETRWFDVDRQASGGTYSRHPDRVIRLRFFAEPTHDERTELWSEAVVRHTLDPSVSGRVAERMVPVDHPGDSLLQQILETVRIAAARGDA